MISCSLCSWDIGTVRIMCTVFVLYNIMLVILLCTVHVHATVFDSTLKFWSGSSHAASSSY